MGKIPVYIITGFLGAGKTTYILKLLDQKPEGEKWAIIVNEFGKVSVDSKTLGFGRSRADRVFEISGGCICCSSKLYFLENLEKIVRENKYSRIIIEPTGLGGADMVREIVSNNARLSLMPVTCLVDLAAYENPRLQLVPVYKNQIIHADRIVFSKTDLMDEAQSSRLMAKFKQDFPGKTLLANASASPEILAAGSQEGSPENEKNGPGDIFYFNGQKGVQYREESFSLDGNKILDPEQLLKKIKNDKSIVRAKGYVHTRNGWLLFNYSLSGYTAEAVQDMDMNLLVLVRESGEPRENKPVNQ